MTTCSYRALDFYEHRTMVTSSTLPSPPVLPQLPAQDGYVVAELFGGAMRMQVPAGYTDVSRIRQLPDNQEVYTQFSSDQSIILELVEPPREALADQHGAAAWHWHAVAEDASAPSAALRWAGTAPISYVPKLASRGTLSLAAGIQSVAKFRDGVDKASEVRLHLACIALPAQSTHVLLSFAAPQRLHPQGSSARAGAESTVVPQDAELPAALPFYHALNSLEVLDWNLFG